ncbi:unnamed protein product [Musa acuminata subsp. burmannicoides]
MRKKQEDETAAQLMQIRSWRYQMAQSPNQDQDAYNFHQTFPSQCQQKEDATPTASHRAFLPIITCSPRSIQSSQHRERSS